MLVKELIDDCKENFGCMEVSGIAFDTANVQKGYLFFCLKGRKHDGRDFLNIAAEKGAVCAVVDEKNSDSPLPLIKVSNVRRALTTASARFFGNPQNAITMVGITGTNGKTTTSYIVKSILEQCGKKVGIIGTNGIYAVNEIIPCSGMTTPDPIELFRALSEMLKKGVTHVVMEVSAHALALDKTFGIKFAVSAFTNLTQDHLDYFYDMETYGAAKQKLFSPENSEINVVNVDDPFGKKLCAKYRKRTKTYGVDNPADAFAINVECSFDGMRFVMNICDDIIPISSSLSGKFNIYNIMCASLIAHELGATASAIQEGVRKLKSVAGRFNIINTANYSIVIDFAHTADGLKNAIGTARELAKGRVITVFGCGGDRDKDKRGKMGRVASDMSDYCVITSDNPRSENPDDIIQEIRSGMLKDNHIAIQDRKDAIKYALECACDNDVVLIAGKGAEKYQEISGVKYDYNDEEYIKSLIEENLIK